MVLEEKKVKNICNFYVSEYHLEIMLLPYISKKIDNEENITIITEIDLESTLNVVIERINLDKDKKEKIKKIGWNIQNIENIIPNTNVILIGSKKFINEKVFELKERQVENLEIIACYNYNEVKNDMKEIVFSEVDKRLSKEEKSPKRYMLFVEGKSSPKKIHTDLDTAEEEAKRLTTQESGSKVFLVEIVKEYKSRLEIDEL